MTLHTRILVTSPGIDARATFDQARQLIGASDQDTWWESPQLNSENTYRHTMDPGFHMEFDQGLPALMWVDHWNGELSPEHEHDKWCYEWDDAGKATNALECTPDPQGYIEINFDTAYGYAAENGASCSDLHAWLVQEMGRWIAAQDGTWEWYDESGHGWAHGPGWGTLGDPDVGMPGSSIPKTGRDEKRDFLAVALAAVIADTVRGGELDG